jgi:hypothetical protein
MDAATLKPIAKQRQGKCEFESSTVTAGIIVQKKMKYGEARK